VIRGRGRAALFGLSVVAAAACTVGRKDAGGLRASPPAEPEPAVVPASREPEARSPARATSVRTIGRCDAEQRAKGVARFTLAHFNDLQARYSDRVAGRSRYAYVAGYLRQLKEQVPETLVLDAGDDYEKGSIAELRSMGEATRRMTQALPIDVRTIGNHDFAYGQAAVLRDVSLSAHPVLAANVRHIDLPASEQPLRPFVRVDVGCVRVGVIGLVTQNYGADDQPSKEPFDGVFAHDARYAEVLEREVKAHRDEVDVMIALTHLGYWDDSALAMTPGARGVDLLVGAHTEDLLKEPLVARRPDGTRTWIMQAGHFGQTLGRADLVVNLRDRSIAVEKYRIVDVDASLPAAEDVDALVSRVERDAEPDAQTVLATTREAVPQGRPMVDLVWRATSAEWGADAMLVGTDLFWKGLPRGPVTLQRMYDAVLVQRQPAGTAGFSSLWVVEMSGAELALLRGRLRSYAYEMRGPSRLDPKRRYRLVVDKRALTYPRALFGDGAKLEGATFGGELVDVLEAYARSRTAKGKTLD
jgi:5'-nucleotidase / UDP-sugar diphosphatase